MISLYNSASRSKEVFTPIEQDTLKIYSCGPTVYSYQHIGNLRAAIFTDTLKRVFRYFGYAIEDVVNITDVGHLVSDESEGEDKMLKASKKENKDPYQIARFYEEAYLRDLAALQVIKPKYLPRATEHIQEQIDLIRALEEKGYTYQTQDGIYFDVSKFSGYGALSGQSLEEKKAGARVSVASEKRNPQDFALWKFLVGENAHHIMHWDAPWGKGFPGWHLECSAMSHKYLGSRFDIHTGGIDHLPVHHENERAQNLCSGWITHISFWVHNAHLLVNNQKMAKSEGNVYNLRDLEEQGFDPLAFRELCLRAHYRKTMNFSLESLSGAQSSVRRINECYRNVSNLQPDETKDTLLTQTCQKRLAEFEEAIADDLNIAQGLAAIYALVHDVNKHETLSGADQQQVLRFLEQTDLVVGLLHAEDPIPEEVWTLARKRQQAREQKDFATADKLREEIRSKGFEVKDVKGTDEGFLLERS